MIARKIWKIQLQYHQTAVTMYHFLIASYTYHLSYTHKGLLKLWMLFFVSQADSGLQCLSLCLLMFSLGECHKDIASISQAMYVFNSYTMDTPDIRIHLKPDGRRSEGVDIR